MVCMSHSLLATSAVNQTNFSKSIIGQASNSIIDSESIKAMCEFDYLSLILHTSHLYGFSHLSLHVVCNICWLNKPLLIHITCVGSLSCVSLHMCIQIPWWNITLITHSTFVVSFLCEFDTPPPSRGRQCISIWGRGSSFRGILIWREGGQLDCIAISGNGGDFCSIFSMYLTKFEAKMTKTKWNYTANVIMNVLGAVCQSIHYFPGKQGLAVDEKAPYKWWLFHGYFLDFQIFNKIPYLFTTGRGKSRFSRYS